MGTRQIVVNVPEKVLLAEKSDEATFARELPILAAVKLIRHRSICNKLVYIDVPQCPARGRIHRQEITDGIAAEQNIAGRR